jgi:hypothetical protein
VFALVVIGPPGSGKTSVVTALHDVLVDSDVAHGVIEVEALAWGHPDSDDQAFRHLASLVRQYESGGCPLLIVGATATSADYLAAVITAIGPDDYRVVGLDADPETLRERIVAREPPEWSGLSQLLEEVEGLAATSRSLTDVHFTCCTEDTSPFAVANSVRQAFPETLRKLMSEDKLEAAAGCTTELRQSLSRPRSTAGQPHDTSGTARCLEGPRTLGPLMATSAPPMRRSKRRQRHTPKARVPTPRNRESGAGSARRLTLRAAVQRLSTPTTLNCLST